MKKILRPLVLLKRRIISAYYNYIGKHNPKKLVDIRYRDHFGKNMNWENPKTLNEKILWLEFNTDTTDWTRLADKYRVREYIESLGLSDILVKLYGMWDKAEDIDWDSLPNKFVMKVNNGSGDVLVCNDKTHLNIKRETKKFNSLVKNRFGYNTAESHYIAIKPCIIAEELLEVNKQVIETSSLIDYKIWCFNGIPESIWACYNRTHDSVEVATYDLEWNFHPEYSVFTKHYIRAKQLLPKPKSLQQMLEIAAKLSAGFPQVRVDLYEVDGKPYFGEMTFSSNYGMMDFYTQQYQEYLGSKVNIKDGK